MHTKLWTILLVTLLLLQQQCDAIYLPGKLRQAYKKGDEVPIYATRVDSLNTAIPFDYNHFDFCPSSGKVHPSKLNLGERLLGNTLENTAYDIKFLENKKCTELCKRTYDLKNQEDVKNIKIWNKSIGNNYNMHWRLDNLDVLLGNENVAADDLRLNIPIGNFDPKTDSVLVYNYAKIKVKYHHSDIYQDNVIVGAEVEIHSVNGCGQGEQQDPYLLDKNVFKKDEGSSQVELPFYYSVTFEEDKEHPYRDRWEFYQDISEENVHWYYFILSFFIILFLFGLIGLILLRTVYRDIARYNSQIGDEFVDANEDYGWKLVHGDVFRSPRYPLLLSSLVGSGTQLFLMAFLCSLFAFLHLTSPAQRGSIITSALAFFVVMGFFAGLTSAKLYKCFHGEKLKLLALTTSFLVPGVVFVIFCIVNLVWMFEGSSSAISIGNMCGLIAMWFCVSVPFTCFGTYLGYKQDIIPPPVRVNPIPREVPVQDFCNSPTMSMALAGLLPFISILSQIMLLEKSIWNHRIYYLPVLYLLLLLILMFTCSLTSIVFTYRQLVAEDYHWWWRSYMTSGSIALYLFFFNIVYFGSNYIHYTDNASLTLYFCFTLLMTVLLWVMTGFMGLISSYAFVYKIYSSVKVD